MRPIPVLVATGAVVIALIAVAFGAGLGSSDPAVVPSAETATPTPTLAPTPTPTPEASPIEPVAIATDTDCVLSGLDEPIAADAQIMLTLQNKTDGVVNFATGWAEPPATHADFEAYFEAEHQRALAGDELLGPPDFGGGAASRVVEPGATGEFLLPSRVGIAAIACIHLDGESRGIDAYLSEPFEVIAPTP